LATWLRAFSEYTTTCRGLKGLVAAIDTDTQNALTSWWYATLLPAATSLLERAQRTGVVRDDVTTHQVLRLVNAVALAHEQAGLDDDQTGPLLNLIIDGLRAHRDFAE